MEQADALALAGMVCARICHDLAGTLGAMSGMLDMVAESLQLPPEQPPDTEALALAQDCARELNARLRLLRAAWGADAEVGDLAALLPGLPNVGKLSVSLDLVLEEDPHRQFAACLLVVAAGTLPLGGNIWLSGSGSRLSLRVEGRRAAWPAGLLRSAAEPLEPRGVAAAMARLRAESLGLELRLKSEWELEAGMA